MVAAAPAAWAGEGVEIPEGLWCLHPYPEPSPEAPLEAHTQGCRAAGDGSSGGG